MAIGLKTITSCFSFPLGYVSYSCWESSFIPTGKYFSFLLGNVSTLYLGRVPIHMGICFHVSISSAKPFLFLVGNFSFPLGIVSHPAGKYFTFQLENFPHFYFYWETSYIFYLL